MTALSCNLTRMELNLSDSMRITPSASDVCDVDHKEAQPCALLPLVAERVTMIGFWPKVGRRPSPILRIPPQERLGAVDYAQVL